jgi:ParB-like chromosome segregation protein Spo0J
MTKTLSPAGTPSTQGGTPRTPMRLILPTTAIIRDEANRRVVEDDDFVALCDAIQVLGVLQAIHVWRRSDGTHQLIDGERRWTAARRVGLVEIPCDVWSGDTDPRRLVLAGVMLNEHRRAHSCLHVARRLRDIKNECGLSHSEVATQTGLPLDRVKTYFSLFGGSDQMLTFLDEKDVPLKVAVELVRYERTTNEARARRLLRRYSESPLTVQEIVALRKREQRRADDGQERTDAGREAANPFVDRLEAQVRRDPARIGQIEELARRLGYRLVPIASSNPRQGS